MTQVFVEMDARELAAFRLGLEVAAKIAEEAPHDWVETFPGAVSIGKAIAAAIRSRSIGAS